jgi:hypothetical protein
MASSRSSIFYLSYQTGPGEFILTENGIASIANNNKHFQFCAAFYNNFHLIDM